jgi:hypothetical protein
LAAEQQQHALAILGQGIHAVLGLFEQALLAFAQLAHRVLVRRERGIHLLFDHAVHDGLLGAVLLGGEYLVADRGISLALGVDLRQQGLAFGQHHQLAQVLAGLGDTRAIGFHPGAQHLQVLLVGGAQPRFAQGAIGAAGGAPVVGQAQLADCGVHVVGSRPDLLQAQGADDGQCDGQCQHGGKCQAEPGADLDVLDMHNCL